MMSLQYISMRQFETQIYPEIPPFGTSLFHKQIQPKDQSFIETIRFSLFPYFESYTFCFFWLILNTFVFFYSLSYKPQSNSVDSQLLKISQAALFQLGQNYPYYIVAKYHYYRVLTCMVLFRNFYHYLMVSLGILTAGSYVEGFVGFKRAFVLVIISGVTGVLTSSLINKNASLESTTPVCGLIGFILALFSIERNRLWKYYVDEKKQMIVLIVTLAVIYWHLSSLYSNINLLPQVFALGIGFIFFFADSSEPGLSCSRLMARIYLTIHIGIVALIFFFNFKPDRIQL